MDNYLVSARKYRPDTFQSVVGQSALTITLKNAIKNNQLAHAYLFCGPRGVGKTTCARIFAKTINCMNPGPEGEACNECESCKSFNEQRSLNIFELDAASNNSVDGIRILVDQVRIPPQLGKYKVYIIDEVHMLSQSAFNAFLKTLEEPPHHAIFILATTEKHKIIPTILSRCQIYDFSRISVPNIVSQLKRVAGSEHIEFEDEALNVIAVKSDGGMRDALSIFDQVAGFGNGKVTYQDTIYNLNVLDYDYFFKLTTSLINGDVSNALLIFNDILNHGFDGQHFISGLSAHFRDLLVCKDPSTVTLLEVGANIRNQYQEQSSDCPVEFLYAALRICNDCDLAYRESKNKRLLVEIALIRTSQLMDSKKKITELIDDVYPAPILPLIKSQDAVITGNDEDKPTSTALNTESKNESTKSESKLSGYKSIRSLKSVGKAKATENENITVTEVAEPEMNEKFSLEKLVKVWNEYANQIDEDIHMANAMKAIDIELLENNGFEVTVSNQVLQKKMEENRGYIEAFLKNKLKNSFIRMDVKLAESVENKRPFTNRERLEAMAKKNPNLLLFYKTFGLDLK
jgi:DNA polymerase III subunit gamma/tau